MSYKKIFDTFPTNIDKYRNNIFTIKSDLETFKSQNISLLDENINLTGSNIFSLTSSLDIFGNVNLNNNYEVKNKIDLNNNIILSENNTAKIISSEINFTNLEVTENITTQEITGNLHFIDKNLQKKLVIGRGSCQIESVNNKKFNLTRQNNTRQEGSINEVIFTCDPNDGITNPILEPHYVRHSLLDNGITEDDKYNIRNNVGTDLQYCTNTVIIRPGWTGERNEFVKSFMQGTAQGFRFKNQSVMPGWSTGSNNVIGNDDIYWPVSLSSDVKKKSQTVILDFSYLLENNLLLPGKSIKIFIEDDYDVENTYPLLIKEKSGTYFFPSGSSSFGDDTLTGGGGNNENSRILTRCTFDKDDLDGDSSGEDDLSSIRGDRDPISNQTHICDLSPWIYPEGLFRSVTKNNFSGFFVNRSRKIQNNNIGISTIKPRLLFNLGSNVKIINSESYPRFLKVKSSMKVTKSPPVLASFESANKYRFFNTYSQLYNLGYINAERFAIPAICHKIFPDVFEVEDGSYFKDKKIEYNEIKNESNSVETWTSGGSSGLTRYNNGLKIAGWETYTVLSSSFYYDIKNDPTINNFLKHNFESFKSNKASGKDAQVFKSSLDVVFPFIGLKSRNNNIEHSLGNNIKDDYYMFSYNNNFRLTQFKNPVFITRSGFGKPYNRRTLSVGKFFKSPSGLAYAFYDGINSNIPTGYNSANKFWYNRTTRNGFNFDINSYNEYFYAHFSSNNSRRTPEPQITLGNVASATGMGWKKPNIWYPSIDRSVYYCENLSSANVLATDTAKFVFKDYNTGQILNDEPSLIFNTALGSNTYSRLVMTYNDQNNRAKFNSDRLTNTFTLTYLGYINNTYEWAIT